MCAISSLYMTAAFQKYVCMDNTLSSFVATDSIFAAFGNNADDRDL